MYIYNHNHSSTQRMSWRSFQRTLQRESKQNVKHNAKSSLSSSSLPYQKDSSPSYQKKTSAFKPASFNRRDAPLQQNFSSISSLRKNNLKNIGNIPPKQRSAAKKILLSIVFLIISGVAIQKAAPIFIDGSRHVFTAASAFVKDNTASIKSAISKQISSITFPKFDISTPSINIKKQKKQSIYLSKQDIKAILQDNNLLNLTNNIIKVNENDSYVDVQTAMICEGESVVKESRTLTVTTSLNMRLQNFLLEQIESLKLLNRGKPEIIAMVVMEPHTGKIIGMAGFDSQYPDINPCTQREYPAASLFKMVTASAALETCGYSPATAMYFSGGKYTLYKRQVSEEKNLRFLTKVTLAEAFAQSINPVFGKLGSLILGKDVLEKYASSFGFNQEIDSEISFTPGSFTINDDNSYQWAEVASGFNKTTTISPVFGAMIASTMLNSGKTPVPCIVESIKDEKGKQIYKRKSEILNDTLKPDTAKAIMQMMNGTIITGTARKYFRGSDKDSVLSKLFMGGKTGSLSNYDNSIRFDWFSGFCSDSQDNEQIVVSVLVGHGKYIGTKASMYGRLIFKEYFNNYFASNLTELNNI